MRRHLSYANVISTVCLFIVLGGSAYAAATITGKQVKNNSLTGADIRNGTLRNADFRRGVLPPAGSSEAGAPGQQGPQGEQGPQGPKGDAGPGAVPIALTLTTGEFKVHEVDAGSWTIGFSCTDREGRPQVQVWARSDADGVGRLDWIGIRSHSSEGSFVTDSGSPLDTELRGIDSRWAPAGGWAAEGLDIQYRSGNRASTASFHMRADDVAENCTVAGTVIPS